jgi:hypothetical protein
MDVTRKKKEWGVDPDLDTHPKTSLEHIRLMFRLQLYDEKSGLIVYETLRNKCAFYLRYI